MFVDFSKISRSIFTLSKPLRKANWTIILLCFSTAATFWFFNALNKVYTTRIDYPIELVYNKDSLVLVKEPPREIAINIVNDKAEADHILEWLKRKINETWEQRKQIEPCFETSRKPNILDVLKRLPKTNCRECGQNTCMVFAALVAEGTKKPDDCPQLDEQNKSALLEYIKAL